MTASRQAPPEGFVTLLFSDVEGSTARWERFGAAFGAALEAHNAILQGTAERNSGVVVKTVGDGFMMAFADPVNAVRAAFEAQEALEAEQQTALWQSVDGIRVRIGLHSGEPVLRHDDLFGPPVNRAARICDAGHGGMTLLSGLTASLVREHLPPEAILTDRGPHRLKDLGQPEQLYELRHIRARDEPIRPLRTLEAIAHNFPAQVTSFVGRARELSEVIGLLRAGQHRLITLSGPGGTGKTRLALQAAASLLQDYPGGVWLVDLAATRDPAAVPTAIALALGIGLRADEEPQRQVTTFLCERRCLLLLDNFEQVTEAAPAIANLLRACAELTCLITSRELLHILGEREFTVEPLRVPPPDDPDPAACESVRLFVERCQAFRPGFDIAPANAEIIGEICRRLDGIPLAIELAAARTRGMSPLQVLERLTRRFDLLAESRRDLPERQRTLRSALDWSYDLLPPDERVALAEASVFSGGFFLEAAEEVITAPNAVDLVFSLRDKSLLRTDEAAGAVRYAMLETVREYASERLREERRGEAMRARHAQCYLARARGWSQTISEARDSADAMLLFTIDLDNVRAGMDWCAERADAAGTVEFAKALFPFLRRRGLYTECDTRLAVAEDAARSTGDRVVLARLLNQRGLVAWDRFSLEPARELFRESYGISRDLGDTGRMLPTLINLGNVVWGHGDYPEARRVWEEALGLATEPDQERYRAVLWMNLGIVAIERGDLEDADGYLTRALAAHRGLRNDEGVAFTLYNRSDLNRARGDNGQALADARDSLRIYSALGERRYVALAEVRVAASLLASGLVGEAESAAQDGLRIAREVEDPACEAYAQEVLGEVALALGDCDAARDRLLHAFDVAVRTDNAKQTSSILTAIADLLLARHCPEAAYLALSAAPRPSHAEPLARTAPTREQRGDLFELLSDTVRQTLDRQAAATPLGELPAALGLR